MTNRESISIEKQQTLALANEVLRKSDETGDQSIDAITRLQRAHAADPCSDANMALMRQIDVGSSYIQAVGHVEGNRILCSSLGRFDPGIPLGPVGYVSATGVNIRPEVEFSPGSGLHFVIADKKGYVVILHRDLVIDTFTDSSDVSLGVSCIRISRSASTSRPPTCTPRISSGSCENCRRPGDSPRRTCTRR